MRHAGWRSARHALLTRALLTLFALGVAAACGGSSQSGPKDLSATRLFAQSSPAVMQIYSQFSAPVTVPDTYISPAAKAVLLSKLQALVDAGQLDPNNTAAVTAAAYTELTAHFFEYVTPDPNPGSVAHLAEQTGFLGSGFVISPDGILLTNAHVAAPGDDQLKPALINQALDQLASAVAASVGTSSIPASLQPSFFKQVLAWALKYAQIGKIDSKILTFSNGKPLSSTSGIVADVVTNGTPVPGKDVAVLKMEGQHNVPTLPLGDDSSLQTGDKLYVIGYPGAVLLNPALKADQPVDPTLTTGSVSGRKQLEGGWSAIQTDAATTHGNSGGPVLNSKGEVVGLLTFGSIDPSTGQEVQGLNFAVPTGVAKEFLSKSGTSAKSSPSTNDLQKGFDEYDQKHYKLADKWFTQADNLYPNNSLIQEWKRKAENEVSAGHDQTPFYYCWLNTCPK
ncbi:MAG: S1C family serine protease [Candidatus Dormibacteraeota bacterium]|nr:S1C family serine protease [Candidatus Dormibacteraeota bacterium]